MEKSQCWTAGLLLVVMMIFISCDNQSLDVESSRASPGDAPQMVMGKSHATSYGQLNFRTHLKGDNEVPSVDTKAQGQVIFKVSKDGSSIEYKLIVANIDNVFMAHIHNAPAGENGGVVAWLYPGSPPPQLIEGSTQGVLAEGVITADDLTGALEGQPLSALIEEMRNGNTYVNVHTTENRPGEIRGQIN